jgi:hypothetical protein
MLTQWKSHQALTDAWAARILINDFAYSNLVLVGDLQDLPGVLGLLGFEFNFTKETGRNSSENEL